MQDAGFEGRRLDAGGEAVGLDGVGDSGQRGVGPAAGREDVAGAGGTSWAAVEGRRAGNHQGQDLGEIFRDWGIPTAQSLATIRARFPDLPLIASGGIRHGLDGAKAMRLGADLVGQAAALLPAAMQGTDAVIAHVEGFARALALACFATGSKDLRALKKAPLRG